MKYHNSKLELYDQTHLFRDSTLLRGKVETLLMRMYVLMCAARRRWQPLGVVLLVPDELLPKILSNKFTESRLCIS